MPTLAKRGDSLVPGACFCAARSYEVLACMIREAMGAAPIGLRDPKTTNALLEELSQAITSHSEASLHIVYISVGIAPP